MNPSEEEEYRYLTIGELGRGGMGTVWEMHDTALNRRIAFKQMHPELVGAKSFESRFLNEARILALLEHPGIVPIHEMDVSSEDGAHYYTMEKVRGESLQSILDGLKNRNKAILRRWTLVRLMGAFSRLCETVAFVHEKGILHRDIKPDNVMLGRFGEVFLVDWGVAKEIGKEESGGEDDTPIRINQTRLSDGGTSLFTMADNIYGTPGYMSPELAKGEDTYSDGGSDIFALGAILYQILTLRPPYEGEGADEILSAAKKGEMTPVAKVPGLRPHLPDGKVPGSLAAITMMALSVDRENRYSTAQGMRRDIEAFLQGKSTKAQEAGTLKTVQLFVRRNPVPTAVGVLAALVAIGILIFGLSRNFERRDEAIKARDLAFEKKEAFLLARKEAIADRAIAARRFAQLAWARLQLADVERAQDLATSALEFKGGPEAEAQSHLVLGICQVLNGDPELAKPHWEKAEPGAFMDGLEKAGEVVSWPELFEDSGLFALALKSLEDQPALQFEKLKEILGHHWGAEMWDLFKPETGGIRLTLKKGIAPEKLDFIQGWPIDQLVLGGIPIADLGRLSGLLQLRNLELKKGHLVKDLSPLSEFSQLTKLSISNLYGHSYDLSPLASLGQLEQLYLAGDVLTLESISSLKLTHLKVGRLVDDTDLTPLSGMRLKSLEVENPTHLEALSGVPLEVFRPGYLKAGISKREFEILATLPIQSLRLEGEFNEEFAILVHSKSLRRFETNQLHDLSLWSSSGLKMLQLNGNDHDLSGIEETSITHLHLSSPPLYPLLSSKSLEQVSVNGEPLNLTTPTLSQALIEADWLAAKAEAERLWLLYQDNSALVKTAVKALPVFSSHLAEAELGMPSTIFQPKKSFQEHSYQWFKTPMSWAEAKDMARSLGGQLVAVDSAEEWSWLEKEFGIPRESNSPWSGGENRIWIGSSNAGAARSVTSTEIRNRTGDAPSIYITNGKLVLLPTAPESLWSFIIEWEQPVIQPPEADSES